MPRPAEIHGLTGIRYLAAATVVLYHFVPASSGWRWAWADGWLAVPFFFVLSGAVLVDASLPALRAGHTISTRQFLTRRLARIYPVYLLSFVMGFIPFVTSQLAATASAAAAGLRIGAGSLMFLTLVQSWFTTPWTSGVVNSPAWSLSVEWFFYLCFLPLLRGLRVPLQQGDGSWRAAFGAALLAQAGLAAGERLLTRSWPTPIPHFWEDYFWRGPYAHLPFFVAGMLVGGVLRRPAGGRRPLPPGLLTWGACACLVALLVVPAGPDAAAWKRVAMLPVAAATILGLAREETVVSWLLGTRWLRLLGEASYALYILQFPLDSLLGGFLPPHGVAGALARLVCYSAISVATVMIVERPGRALLMSWLSRAEPA